jgi:hypothetical protein
VPVGSKPGSNAASHRVDATPVDVFEGHRTGIGSDMSIERGRKSPASSRRIPAAAPAEKVEKQVRIECDDCGVVRVRVPELKLRCCLDTDVWACCFRCPLCGVATNQVTRDRSALDLLVAIGAQVEYWRLPKEMAEAKVVAPALTLDDLLDFHLLLERDDWRGSLSSTVI